jgi:14-3-3 protein epsilon
MYEEITDSNINTEDTTLLSTINNNSLDKSYSRDELVYLCKLYERAEHYDEAVDYAITFIKMKPILNSEERIVFSNAFKNLLILKRNSLRYLDSIIKKEKKGKGSKNVLHLEEIISKVEDELFTLVNTMLEVLDELLLPNSKKPEAQVFYMKLKGDYFRYKAEFTKDDEKEVSIDMAEQAYNEAYMLSEEQLPITSLIRVGLAINFSIFYYEEKGMLDEAIMIARSCFDEAIKMVDEVDMDKAKDYILLVHLLKENVIFWNTEKAEEVASNN